MRKSENFEFNLIELSDTFSPDDSNQNFEKLDKELGSIEYDDIKKIQPLSNGEKIKDALSKIKVAIDRLISHIADRDNPHNVTKGQLGLENVENVTVNDHAPTYDVAENLSELQSGEKISEAFGKIAKGTIELKKHISDVDNPHKVTKEQIGLENVENTSDIDKPISTAQQNAIDKAYADSKAYTDEKVSSLVGSSSETLKTIEQISTALKNNEDVTGALNESIGSKANQVDLDNHTSNNNIHVMEEDREKWNKVDDKVDKIEGLGLSHNDFTDEEKEKLRNIDTSANNVTIDEEFSDISDNPLKNCLISKKFKEIDRKVTVNLLAPTFLTSEISGVLIENNNDGTYTLNGHATDDIYFKLIQNDSLLIDVVKKYNTKFIGGIDEEVYADIHAWNDSYEDVFSYYEKGNGFIIKKDKLKDAVYFRISMIIKKDTVLNNIILRPFLTTNTDATIEDCYVGYTGKTGTLNRDVEQLRKDLDNYEIPTASNTVKGGVKIGSNITNKNGTLSITKDNIVDALGYIPKEGINDDDDTEQIPVDATEIKKNFLKLNEEISDIKSQIFTNLLNPKPSITSSHGIVLTDNGDGSFIIDGTTSEGATFTLQTNILLKANTTYQLLGCPVNKSCQLKLWGIRENAQANFLIDSGEGAIETVGSTSTCVLSLVIDRDVTLNNVVLRPFLTTNTDITIENFISYTGGAGKLNGDVAEIKAEKLDISKGTDKLDVEEKGFWADATVIKVLNDKIEETNEALKKTTNYTFKGSDSIDFQASETNQNELSAIVKDGAITKNMLSEEVSSLFDIKDGSITKAMLSEEVLSLFNGGGALAKKYAQILSDIYDALVSRGLIFPKENLEDYANQIRKLKMIDLDLHFSEDMTNDNVANISIPTIDVDVRMNLTDNLIVTAKEPATSVLSENLSELTNIDISKPIIVVADNISDSITTTFE